VTKRRSSGVGTQRTNARFVCLSFVTLLQDGGQTNRSSSAESSAAAVVSTPSPAVRLAVGANFTAVGAVAAEAVVRAAAAAAAEAAVASGAAVVAAVVGSQDF